MKKSGIKVYAPASISNLAVGFDILGMALEGLGDEVIGWKTDQPGITLSGVFGNKQIQQLPIRENAACIAAQAVLDQYGDGTGICMELHKHIPIGSGLGGSAASAVAGAMLANELCGKPLDKRALLHCAMKGEEQVTGGRYPDNVCASMLGGLVLVSDIETLRVQRLPVPRGLYILVVLPDLVLTTMETRQSLTMDVPLPLVVRQQSRLGSFIQGLWNSDFETIRYAMKDEWIEPQRAGSIPGFYTIQSEMMKAGALGSSISGSGPAIFGLFDNTLASENAAEKIKAHYDGTRVACKLLFSKVNMEGAVRC